MSSETYICVWCGIEKRVRSSRSTSVCRDCLDLEKAFGGGK